MKRRKLTPFLAHEMLYDFATDQLDADRRAAVEEFLETDRESQSILANIEASLAFAEKLSAATVQPEILGSLKEAESAFSLGKKYSSWSEWPEALRWSLTAIGLSALVAGVVAVVPWSRLNPKTQTVARSGAETVEVAQIPQSAGDEAEAVNVAETEGSGDEAPEDVVADEGSGDEHEESAEASRPAAAPTSAPVAAATPLVAVLTPAPSPTPAPIAEATSSPVVPIPRVHYTPYFLARRNPFPLFLVSLNYIPNFIVPPKLDRIEPEPAVESPPVQTIAKEPSPTAPTPAASTKPVSVSANADSELSDESSSTDEKARGFVYRAFMALPDLEEVGPQITEDLLSLGAEKAGEVELGWKRGTGRYYHFAMPAENEKKVLEKLQVYGPVRISKDPHPRVMPKGQVRFILWVESAN